MASKLAEAFVEITTKMAGLDAGLKGAEARLNDFVGKGNGILATIGVGLSAAGAISFIGDMTNAGADLGETMSKVNVVFGDAAGTVISNSERMADQFGSVKKTTLDAAANIGLIGQAAGLSSGASAGLANNMIRLADDASSFFNVPLDQALEKIRSGLVGEAEPLRQFGVLLSEGAVKAQALEMGFKEVGGAFTEQEKVLARVEIITKSLAKAQGDHERTMNSYTNQIRRLSGEWENMKAKEGQALAGGMALNIKAMREGGAAGFLGKSIGSILQGAPGVLGKAARSVFGGENLFQAAADEMMGVTGTGGIVGGPTETQKRAANEMDLWASRAAQANREQDEARARRFRAGQETFAPTFDAKGKAIGFGKDMPGFGAFGMFGNLGMDISRQGMAGYLDQQVADKRAKMGEWGGGHVTDPMSFLKQAQDKLLQKPDETAKKQLDELVKIREAVSKDSKGAPVVAVAKGREH